MVKKELEKWNVKFSTPCNIISFRLVSPDDSEDIYGWGNLRWDNEHSKPFHYEVFWLKQQKIKNWLGKEGIQELEELVRTNVEKFLNGEKEVKLKIKGEEIAVVYETMKEIMNFVLTLSSRFTIYGEVIDERTHIGRSGQVKWDKREFIEGLLGNETVEQLENVLVQITRLLKSGVVVNVQ